MLLRWRNWNIFILRVKAEILGIVPPEPSLLQGDFLAVYEYPKGGFKEDASLV